ncbi:MAG: hypothetical protein R2712_03460 [Vicinamibacterales bacterium]
MTVQVIRTWRRCICCGLRFRMGGSGCTALMAPVVSTTAADNVSDSTGSPARFETDTAHRLGGLCCRTSATSTMDSG